MCICQHAAEAHQSRQDPTLSKSLCFSNADIAPNLDLALSASCVGGVLNKAVAAWDDDDGHGTW